MATTDLKLDEPGSLPRPGPIGRSVRLAFGMISTWYVVGLYNVSDFLMTGQNHVRPLVINGIVGGLFLISYVTLRFFAPIFAFQGEGAIRIFYFSLLASHVVLAIAIVPLVSITLIRALSQRFDAHLAGDTVEVDIPGIGVLTNPVAAEFDSSAS